MIEDIAVVAILVAIFALGFAVVALGYVVVDQHKRWGRERQEVDE